MLLAQATAIASAARTGGDSARAMAFALAQAFSQGANAQTSALAQARPLSDASSSEQGLDISSMLYTLTNPAPWITGRWRLFSCAPSRFSWSLDNSQSVLHILEESLCSLSYPLSRKPTNESMTHNGSSLQATAAAITAVGCPTLQPVLTQAQSLAVANAAAFSAALAQASSCQQCLQVSTGSGHSYPPQLGQSPFSLHLAGRMMSCSPGFSC